MRIARFVGAGAFGFVVQLLVLEALRRQGLHYGLAAGLGVEAAILQNFVWHERWTWRDRPSAGAAVVTRLLRYNLATGAVSILGNVAFTMLFVETLHCPVLLANALAVVVLSAVNYIVADRFVFVEAVHSPRSETIGGMRAARRAGM